MASQKTSETAHPYTILAYYRFFPMEENALDRVEAHLYELANEFDVSGLVILSTEGVNMTIAAPGYQAMAVLDYIKRLSGANELDYKQSFAGSQPFRRFKV